MQKLGVPPAVIDAGGVDARPGVGEVLPGLVVVNNDVGIFVVCAKCVYRDSGSGSRAVGFGKIFLFVFEIIVVCLYLGENWKADCQEKEQG